MTERSEIGAKKKRGRIQRNFWNEVGAIEHISLPKLKNAIEREFNHKDDRFVIRQIKLMQTEGKIKIVSKVKVWIKKPESRDTN